MAKRTFAHYLSRRLKDPMFRGLHEEELRKLRIGLQIAEARKKRHMTQKELAERIGTSQGAITRIESGTYTGHSLHTLGKIASALRARLEVRLAV